MHTSQTVHFFLLSTTNSTRITSQVSNNSYQEDSCRKKSNGFSPLLELLTSPKLVSLKESSTKCTFYSTYNVLEMFVFSFYRITTNCIKLLLLQRF